MTEEVKKTLLPPESDDEKLVVIPATTIDESPICIRTADDEGRLVHRGWIDAARPIARQLRNLAKIVIGEAWRVSELAEGSVHSLNAKHGEELGKCPTGRIYTDAKWRARDMRAGGYRTRVGLDVELRDHVLASLTEPYNFDKAVADGEFIDRLEQRLQERGETDVLKMLRIYRSGAEDQIRSVFGIETRQARNTLSKQFHRTLRAVAELLRNSNDKRAA